ncbi:MAG: NADH-quinone oxidoreductase subunit NuoF [Candidatus Aminicenantes bacterium]|nr:NADH-quinone oxidoreductase subunit NuoF [Candidatus Aminicenantes bacterium]
MAEKYLTRSFDPAGPRSFKTYADTGGYSGARKALAEMTPAMVMGEVKAAHLRGRGGAGFPAGLKWGFIPQASPAPKYLCVNADEGEPGTFKDRYILAHDPHLLLEGVVIVSYAVGIHKAYVYVRGEYEELARRLEEAISEAVSQGALGENIFGSGFSLNVLVHRGAGAYICGEETALLESLEGYRGQPRLKPPFPASVGLFGNSTVINNVETLANLPGIILHGADWFLGLGKPKDGGTRLYSVSGSVVKPGVYELPTGTSLREIIFTHAGGLAPGRTLKAVIPGGLSSAILLPGEIDVAMDCDSLAAAGSMIGSAGIIVIDDGVSMKTVLDRVTKFYAHESCGQCTPCRVGTSWIRRIVRRMNGGGRRADDLDRIARLAEAMKGRTFCPFGDAAALPVLALIGKFRTELEG